MKITKQRKTSLGILALALCALAVDKLYLGTASPARAAAAVPVSETAAADAASAAPATRPTVTLAGRLEALAQEEHLSEEPVGDLFGEARWRITSVMGSGERGSVIIDGVRVAVGQTYDGAVLRRVSQTGATFRRGNHEFEVPLPLPEPGTDR